MKAQIAEKIISCKKRLKELRVELLQTKTKDTLIWFATFLGPFVFGVGVGFINPIAGTVAGISSIAGMQIFRTFKKRDYKKFIRRQTLKTEIDKTKREINYLNNF